MKALKSISEILVLKKRAIEQALVRQANIEKAIRREMDEIESRVAKLNANAALEGPADISAGYLLMQSQWLAQAQTKKKDLMDALRVVRSKTEALKTDLGALTGQNNIVDEKIDEAGRIKQRDQSAFDDEQRLDSWRTANR